MFLSGVIEGFYGPPWTADERATLFARMAAWGLNTYLYCPKDDLHHRAVWRESYPDVDARPLQALIEACHAHGLRFLYGIGPGLDIRYGDPADRAALLARGTQMVDLGCDGLALLFDDIPDALDPADLARWGSLAAAQADVANEAIAALRTRTPGLIAAFCPTPYCERMVAAGHGGVGYLEALGAALDPTIDVFWTGPEIVSREITVEHVRDVASRLRRRPVIWDNLHANDYDGRRIILGPYAGRPLALRDEVRGILTNPNTECSLDFVAIRSLARFVGEPGPTWDARRVYLDTLREWQPAFETVAGPTMIDDLTWLADCYYLPYEEGPEAEALLARARAALADTSPGWREATHAFIDEATRRRDFCARLATLRDRPLFNALSRRIWDLREELDLLIRAAQARLASSDGRVCVRSDFHQPRTFRGGTVARLQRLLTQHADGTFTPRPEEET